MVLLPAMLKDQVAEVLRTLFTVAPTTPHTLLIFSAILVFVLPFVVLFVLLGDLTRFYFHALHLEAGDGQAFAPRFTLTGLLLPTDELSPHAASILAEVRADPTMIESLVPANPATRASIDAKLDAYGGLNRTQNPGDAGRAVGLFKLVASRPRTLAEEVAKVEYGMVRHLLRLQVIVMRYVKALLAFLTTAIAVVALLAVVHTDPKLGATAELWFISIIACWAPAIVFVVGSPVRWVDNLLRAEGATVASVASDREFNAIERITILAAIIGFTLATSSMIATLITQRVTRLTTATVIATIVGAAVGLNSAIRRSITTQRR